MEAVTRPGGIIADVSCQLWHSFTMDGKPLLDERKTLMLKEAANLHHGQMAATEKVENSPAAAGSCSHTVTQPQNLSQPNIDNKVNENYDVQRDIVYLLQKQNKSKKLKSPIQKDDGSLKNWNLLRRRLHESHEIFFAKEAKSQRLESIHSLSFGVSALKKIKEVELKKSSCTQDIFSNESYIDTAPDSPSSSTRYARSKDKKLLDSNSINEKEETVDNPSEEVLPFIVSSRTSEESVNKKQQSQEIDLDLKTAKDKLIKSLQLNLPKNFEDTENKIETLEISTIDENLSELARNKFRTVIINCGGVDYRSKIANFSKHPASRLGKIFRAKTKEEILNHCDGYIPGNPPIIYFDRNDQNFSAIIDCYRIGNPSKKDMNYRLLPDCFGYFSII